MPAKRKADPISLSDLMQRYPTKQSVINHLERIRWGDKPHCTKCGAPKAQAKYPGRWWCGCCRQYFTAWTGTPLEDSKVDPRKWLFAAYLLMTARKGISAMHLSKELSVQYNTAWYMLHRLRLGCGGKLETLGGTVDVDETDRGGKDGSKHELRKIKAGRGAVGKALVAGSRQRDGKVIAKPIGSPDAKTFVSFVKGNVKTGSMVYAGDVKTNHPLLNGIKCVWAVIKRGHHGIYYGWIKKHMRTYVNEFTFRFNEGGCESNTAKRLDSLFWGLVSYTITRREFTA